MMQDMPVEDILLPVGKRGGGSEKRVKPLSNLLRAAFAIILLASFLIDLSQSRRGRRRDRVRKRDTVRRAVQREIRSFRARNFPPCRLFRGKRQLR